MRTNLSVSEPFFQRGLRRTPFLAAGYLAAFFLLMPSAARAQATGLLPGAPASFSNLVKKCKDSVVNISTVKTISGGLAHPFSFGDPSAETPG